MSIDTTDKLERETTLIKEFGEVVRAETVIHATMVENPFDSGNAFDHADIPKEGDTFSDTYSELQVDTVRFTVVGRDNDNAAWRVRYDITYSHARTNPSLSQGYPLRGSASLLQKQVHQDRQGQAIKVVNPDDSSEENTATIDVLVPTQNTVREAIISTNSPETTVRSWINWINSDDWTGQGGGAESEAGMWLCTAVQWELFNARTDPKKYKFQFEFERASDEKIGGIKRGWDYVAFWRNKDGLIPSNAEKDNGVTVVPWHFTRQFKPTFPTPL